MRKNLNSSILLVAGSMVIRLNIKWCFFMFLTSNRMFVEIYMDILAE